MKHIALEVEVCRQSRELADLRRQPPSEAVVSKREPLLQCSHAAHLGWNGACEAVCVHLRWARLGCGCMALLGTHSLGEHPTNSC